MKQKLKIDYKKSGITTVVFLVFGIFAYFGPLEREDLHTNIATIENEYFTPKLVSDFTQKRTQESGLILAGTNYVAGEYGLIKPVVQKRTKSSGMVSFRSEMGSSLHNEKWGNAISDRLEKKYGDDREIVVKMKGEFCYAEIYNQSGLASLYFENRIHNTVQGFSGPIFMGMEMSLGGELQEVSYITSKETESYLRKVLRSSYLKQYKGLQTKDADHQIDAVSGATITTKAMAEGVTESFTMTATQLLATYYDYDLGGFQVHAKLTYWWIVHILIILGVFLFAMLPQIKKTKNSRLFMSLFTLMYIGFGMNTSFTYITFLMPFMGTEVSLFLGLFAFDDFAISNLG
jgi:NosR/NirI family nitrous oxide reductase transcriptional regulator